MKSIFSVIVCLFLAFSSFAQKKKGKKPAPKPPVVESKTAILPKFTLYSIPDSTVFTEKDLKNDMKTIFIYYGPDCGHCMVFAKKLMDSISFFENTQIVMMSSFEFSKIKRFYDDYKMSQCSFLTMGYDPKYFFVSHFDIRMFPSAYVYSSKGKFLKSFSSEIPIKELIDAK